MKKEYLITVCKIEGVSEVKLTTCDNEDQARQVALQMAKEGVLTFKKSTMDYIALFFDKQ